MPAVWASASDTVSSKEGAARPKPAASSWFGKLSKSYRTLAFASIAFVSVIIHVVANMLVDGSRGQCARPPSGGDNLRPRRMPIHCPSNRLLRRPVSSNTGQSWGCSCGGSLHVRNGASAGRNQFVPARLLGPDIRHSSLHVFAGGHASETGLHFLRSCSHAQLTILSGLHRAVVRRRCRTVSRR